MQIKTFSDEKEWTNASVEFIKNIIFKNHKSSIALSGGSTPKPIYNALSKERFAEKAAFYLVDERYVKLYEPDSNYNMIFTSLIGPFKNTFQKELEFHYFDTTISIEKSLSQYADELPSTCLDLTILGIGPDGHTASLFPNSPSLTSSAPVAHTQTDQFAVKDRLTLTFPPILKSRNLLVLLKNKPEVIAQLQNPTKSENEFPALKLLSHSSLTIFALF